MEKLYRNIGYALLGFLCLQLLCLNVYAQFNSGTLQRLEVNTKLNAPEKILQDFKAGEAETGVIVLLRSSPESLNLSAQSQDSIQVPVQFLSPDAPVFYNLQDENVKTTLRATVENTIEGVVQQLNSEGENGITVTRQFSYLFGFAATVSPAGLERLLEHPEVLSVEKDRIVYQHLSQGIPLMQAASPRSSYSGAGISIAICDTGIDTSHPRLGASSGTIFNDKVIGGYDTGDGDNDPRPGSSGNAHGTACAGIAAGDLGTVGDYIGGVAPEAKLYAIKISTGTGGSATNAAMIAAWEWAVTHQNDDPDNPIMIISTSFGGGRNFSTCDSESVGMTTAAANSVAAGITIFASSGNDGYCDSMGWPACISYVNSVGAVYDAAFGINYPCVDFASCAAKSAHGGCSTGYYAIDNTSTDMVTSYSNSASFLTLFAPSNAAYTTDISGLGGHSDGDYYTDFGGTSAASPYAAGAAAVLQAAAKAKTGSFLTPAEVQAYLVNNGDNVTDSKVAITRPRINLGNSVAALPAADDAYEENDVLSAAWYLNGWERTWLSAISGLGEAADDDWYKIEVNPSAYRRLQAELHFTHANGDIDLELYDAAGMQLASSNSSTNDEAIDYTVSAMGFYYLRVYPVGSNHGNSYDLWWDDLPVAPGPMVSNPSPADGTTVPPGSSGQHLQVYSPDAISGIIHYDDDVTVGSSIEASKNGNYLEADVPYASGRMNNNGTNYWFVVATDSAGGVTRYPASSNLSFTVNERGGGAMPWLTLLLNSSSDSGCADTGDADNDRLLNCVETNTGVFVNADNTGTDPNNPDTDGDSIKDGDEVLGTLAGLDLPAMGLNPLQKNILLEYDWFNDSLECTSHSHRPTAAATAAVSAAFANAPNSNPDGSTGITVIHDYGQGGAFTGGNLISDPDGIIVGGVSGSEFLNHKSAHFAANRNGYFHYILLPHRYNTNSDSSGQAEVNGDDLIVSLYCYGSDSNVAHTVMHELGHNLNLRHGGNVNCNYKPNYNSVMNYKFQFPGADNNCDATGDGVLDYSDGSRFSLNENSLNENIGVCGFAAIDWNGNSTIESPVVYDINSSDSYQVINCGGTYTTLTDHNDWSALAFSGIGDGDGAIPTTVEIISCENAPTH